MISVDPSYSQACSLTARSAMAKIKVFLFLLASPSASYTT